MSAIMTNGNAGEYEQIVSGFRALQDSDFDDTNVDARGRERMPELTDALISVPEPEKAIPELLGVMERLPATDLGSPGLLVHTLERLHGDEGELAAVYSSVVSSVDVKSLLH